MPHTLRRGGLPRRALTICTTAVRCWGMGVHQAPSPLLMHRSCQLGCPSRYYIYIPVLPLGWFFILDTVRILEYRQSNDHIKMQSCTKLMSNQCAGSCSCPVGLPWRQGGCARAGGCCGDARQGRRGCCRGGCVSQPLLAAGSGARPEPVHPHGYCYAHGSNGKYVLHLPDVI